VPVQVVGIPVNAVFKIVIGSENLFSFSRSSAFADLVGAIRLPIC
jgi:hypothetical protein